MHSLALRGLGAALVLLAAALPARALVVSHTAAPLSFSVMAGGGQPANMGTWSQLVTLPGFDPALGTLTHITYFASFSGQGSVVDMNISGSPGPVTPALAALYGREFAPHALNITGPTQIVANGGRVVFNTVFAVNYDFTFAVPSGFAPGATISWTPWFQVPGSNVVETVVPAGTAIAGVRYTYVPERGTSAVLLALALIGLGSHRRRRA